MPALMSIEEAATHLNVSRSTVYRLMESGQLRNKKIGRRNLITAESIAAFLESGGSAEAA